MGADRPATGSGNSGYGTVRARKAAPIRSKVDAAFHRVPALPCFLLERDLALRGSRDQPPGVSTRGGSRTPSSEGGKPGVKRNPRSAPRTELQNLDLPAKSIDPSKRGRSTKTKS